MHYYKRNLGDYAKKAGRLSMLQHGSYTLLIDACYDREQFPTLDEAIEWTWASSTEEIEAVTFVLRKFFTLEDGVYVQKRIQEEIAEYHGKAATNKRIAEDRERKRRSAPTNGDEDQTSRERTVDGAPPNQEPRTTNQEPPTKNQKPEAKATSRFAEFWSAWPAHKRKVDRKKCEAHWARRNLDQQTDTIIAHVHACRASPDWVKQGGAYIPGPLVYLHREQYLAPVDEPAQAPQSAHTGFDTRNYREGIADDGSFT